MRKLLCLVAFTAVLTMIGCDVIHEDYPICKSSHNLTLHFSNLNNDGTEMFDTSIDKIGIFLFDKSDKLVYLFEADPVELAATRSTSITVLPDTYRVVCWANAKENTVITMNIGDHIDNGYVYKQLPGGGDIAENGNPLYYAPHNRTTLQMFTVNKNEQKDVDVSFIAAHIKLDIEVIGYTGATGETEMPYIEITDLYPKYNFVMSDMPTSVLRYIQQTKAVLSRSSDVSNARFNVPRFTKDTPSMIILRQAKDAPIIKSFNLKDELATNNIIPENIDKLQIDLAIKFLPDGNITIEIVKWGGSELDPDLE